MASPSPDGSPVVLVNQGATTTLVLPGLTTSVANDLIEVFVALQSLVSPSPAATVSSVTSAHLTFTKRVSHADASAALMSGEIWWARASGTLSSEVITVQLSNLQAGAAIAAQAFQNASNTKFDPNASLPAVADGQNIPSVTGVSTTLADDLLLYHMITSTQPGTAVPAGFTSLVSQTDFTDSRNFCTQVIAYQSVSSTQSNITVSGGTVGANEWDVIVDALTSDVFTVIPHSQGMIVG